MYMFISQKGLVSQLGRPTRHEHGTQDLHIVLNETQPTFIHLTTPIGGNFFPISTT
jgi:hypothetical protein